MTIGEQTQPPVSLFGILIGRIFTYEKFWAQDGATLSSQILIRVAPFHFTVLCSSSLLEQEGVSVCRESFFLNQECLNSILLVVCSLVWYDFGVTVLPLFPSPCIFSGHALTH